MQTDVLLAVKWMAITVTALAMLWSSVGMHRIARCFGESLVDIARFTAHAYAYEAYPAWSARHPGECPTSVQELSPWLHRSDDRDVWGGRYRLLCASPNGILVVSAGEDGVFGTADDVRSDQ